MPTAEQRRLAVLSKLVLEIFPKLFQIILMNVAPPTEYICRLVSKNLQLKSKLHTDDVSVLERMDANTGYSEFSLRLSYTFLRLVPWLEPPAQNWGNTPTTVDLNLSDDIERIRLQANDIITTSDTEVDENVYNATISQFQQITERIKAHFNQEANFVFDAGVLQMMQIDDAHVMILIERLHSQTIIKDNPFPLSFATEGKARYPRLGLIIGEILPNIAREVIVRKTKADFLYRQIVSQKKINPKAFNKWFTHEEEKKLNIMAGNSYDNIDFTTLYKLIRAFKVLDEPTQGWGKQPMIHDLKISDDIERLRNIRNIFLHKINTDSTEEQMNTVFSEVEEVSNRVDRYLNKPANNSFKSAVRALRTCQTDFDREERHVQAIREIERIQERFAVKNKQAYVGNSFADSIKKVMNELANNDEPLQNVWDTKVDIIEYGLTEASLEEKSQSEPQLLSFAAAKAKGRRDEFKKKLKEAIILPLEKTIMRQYQTMTANVKIKKAIKNIDHAVEAKSLAGHFYQLPLSYGLECIVDKRLDTIYSQIIGDINHPTNQGSSNKDEHVDQFYCMYSSSVSPPDNLKDVLLTEISKAKNLYCRWLLANTNVEPFLEDVFAAAAALKSINKEILKALAWQVVNLFFTKYKDELQSHSAIWLWPGFICKCQRKSESKVCSSQFVIIIETAYEIRNIPEKFLGFNIKQLWFNREYDEAKTETNKTSEYWKNESLVHNSLVTGEEAEKLFHNHSNLTLICPSLAKSTDKSQDQDVVALFCIQLYCRVKGVIPIGDNHFPSFVSKYPTDVIEGCPKMAANRIIIGEKIGTIDLHGNFERQGTLGGFTKHLGYDCFMTCAHVAFDVKSLLSQIDDEIDDKGVKIYIPCPNLLPSVSQCGQVLKRVFEHDDKDRTSIDVALVQLQNSYCDANCLLKDPFGFTRPISHFGLTSVDLRQNCIDVVDICNSQVRAFCSGAFSKITDIVSFASTTEAIPTQFPTFGNPIPSGAYQLLLCSHCHMQLHAGILCGREVFRMYNQLLVKIPLQLGDSGTCIYVQTNTGKSGCIGMAIAFGPGGYTILTPMKEILKKLKH